jgi:Predicted transcriptional regulators
LYTIDEVANKLNISKSKIRFFEKNKLIKPQRDQNNYRKFSDYDLLIIKYIIVMQFSGIEIKEIYQILKSLNDKENCNDLTDIILTEKLKELEAKIDHYKEVIKLINILRTDIPESQYLEHEKTVDDFIEKIFLAINCP